MLRLLQACRTHDGMEKLTGHRFLVRRNCANQDSAQTQARIQIAFLEPPRYRLGLRNPGVVQPEIEVESDRFGSPISYAFRRAKELRIQVLPSTFAQQMADDQYRRRAP